MGIPKFVAVQLPYNCTVHAGAYNGMDDRTLCGFECQFSDEKDIEGATTEVDKKLIVIIAFL
jgi:hypothetical protein